MDELEDLQMDLQIYIYIFTTMEAESDGWDPVKDSLSASPAFPPPPPPPPIHAHRYTRAPE